MSPVTAVMLDAGSLGPDLDHEPLRACADHWHWHEHTPPDLVAERIAGARIAIANKTPIDAAILSATPELELVCVAATGTNNVDLAAAAANGVTVCNVRGYATPTVAQHTLTLMLALATGLPAYTAAVRRGDWQRARHFCLLDHPIIELAGRNLGIIGYGELGRAVAALARAFGMNILISARPGSEAIPQERVPLDDVLARADVLSLHCPLTDANRGLIGQAQLARMKPGAFLINTARGALVDEAALADALRDGTIAGAGVDVLSNEPPANGNPLLADDIPNLIVTPHSAWGSREARQRLLEQVADNIRLFAAGTPQNTVAAPGGS